jgi:enamine deaminase RidA (YjgF/YER057c/UK114 family)
MSQTGSEIDRRLRALGLIWPDPPAALGSYKPVVMRGGFGVVSGQFPLERGRLVARGKVDTDVDQYEARRAAATAALNCIAQIRAATNDFTSFRGLLRLDGYIASAPGFHQQPHVLDAASELLVAVLGPTLGEHARSVVAVGHLPLDATVELVLSFAVSGNGQ